MIKKFPQQTHLHADPRSKASHRKASETHLKPTEARVTRNREVIALKVPNLQNKPSLIKTTNSNGSLQVPHEGYQTNRPPRRVTFETITAPKSSLSRTYSAASSLRGQDQKLFIDNTGESVASFCQSIKSVRADKSKQDFYARYGKCLKNSTSVLVTSSPGVRKRIHPTGSYFSGTLYPASMRRIHQTDHFESLLLKDQPEADLHETDDYIAKEPSKENNSDKQLKAVLLKDEYHEIYSRLPDGSQTCRPIKTSVLLHAARVGNNSWLKELIDYNLKFGFRDVNAVDRNGRTLLTWLASRGIADVLTQLCRVGNIHPNLGDNEGNTPLHYAVRYERTEFLNLLLVYFRGRITIDKRNTLGFTPLMCAGIDGRAKAAQLLLLSGADPTLRDFGRHLRADQWALRCGRLICAEVIIRQVREQLLKFPDSARNWDSRINMEAVVCRGSVRTISCESSREEGFGMKFRQIFRRASTPPHDKNLRAKLIKQLTTAAFSTTSPALPSREYLPPLVKSLLRPLTIPLIKITFVKNDGNTSSEIIDLNATEIATSSISSSASKSNSSTSSRTRNNSKNSRRPISKKQQI